MKGEQKRGSEEGRRALPNGGKKKVKKTPEKGQEHLRDRDAFLGIHHEDPSQQILDLLRHAGMLREAVFTPRDVLQYGLFRQQPRP